MLKYIAVLAPLTVSFVTSGCGTSLWELRYGKEKPSISYTFLTEVGKRDGIYAWRPDTAAAVSLAAYGRDSQGNWAYKNEQGELILEQKTCVLSAAAIKARDSESGLNIGITISGTPAEVRQITRELQRITVLSSKSEAATFLDVALFGICMAAMNNFIAQSEAKGLMQDAISNAANIANASEQTKTTVLAAPVMPPLEAVEPGEPIRKPRDPGLGTEREAKTKHAPGSAVESPAAKSEPTVKKEN